MKKTAKEIILRQTQFEEERLPYEALQDYCIRLSHLGRQSIRSKDFYVQKTDKGRMVGKDIYDATAANGLVTRADGIMSWFMPQNFKWFSPTLSRRSGQTDKMIRTFLQETGEQLRYDIGRSNYYEMKRLKVMDADAVGCAYLFIDEDIRSGRVMCSLPHPQAVYRGEDYWGLTKEIHYVFRKTLGQIAAEFGKEALSEAQRQEMKTNPDIEVKVVHAIYRNDDFDADRPPIGANRRYLAWWVNCDKTSLKGASDGTIIREGGYNSINPID